MMSQSRLSSDSCFAVIVTFNPENTIIDNIKALVNQVALIIVVDNGSEKTSQVYLERAKTIANSVRFIYNGKNLGIGAALNLGIQYGISQGYEWVATFDQDSRVSESYIQKMFDSYHSLNEQEKVAVIAPTYIQETTGSKLSHSSRFTKGSISQNYSEVPTTMTSGTLTKISVFETVGYLDSSLFIDFIDHEFCLRCRKHGMKVIELNDVFLNHNLGSPKIRAILNFRVTSSNHSHVRRYYKYRNRIIICKKYFLYFPMFFLKDFLSFMIEPLKIILVENDRVLKLKYILQGILDGFIGKQGRL